MINPAAEHFSLVIALGHRFDDLSIERALLEETAILIDGNSLEFSELTAYQTRAQVVLLGSQAVVDKSLLDKMPNLRLIVRYGIGIDNVDVEHAARVGVEVANVPEYCIEEVSTHAVALILQANRGIIRGREVVLRGKWGVSELGELRRLSSTTVSVIGFGRIGRRVASALRGLGTRVLVADPFVSDTVIQTAGFESASIEEAFGAGDFVTLHLPVTADTSALVGRELLEKMKSTSWLVNTSRGELIDESALYDTLIGRRIAGAALDVLAVEPPLERNRFVALDNVVITPHSAWFSLEAMRELRQRAATEALGYLKGRGLQNPIVFAASDLEPRQGLEKR